MKHLKSKCFYCDVLLASFSVSEEDFQSLILYKTISNNTLIKSEEIEISMQIYQFFFELLFTCDLKYINKYVFSNLAEIILDQNLDSKFKLPIFMIIYYLITYERGFIYILVRNYDYFSFQDYFISDFMQNFNLESFHYFKRKISQSKSENIELEWKDNKFNYEKQENKKDLEKEKDKGKEKEKENQQLNNSKDNQKDYTIGIKKKKLIYKIYD